MPTKSLTAHLRATATQLLVLEASGSWWSHFCSPTWWRQDFGMRRSLFSPHSCSAHGDTERRPISMATVRILKIQRWVTSTDRPTYLWTSEMYVINNREFGAIKNGKKYICYCLVRCT